MQMLPHDVKVFAQGAYYHGAPRLGAVLKFLTLKSVKSPAPRIVSHPL